MKKYIIMASICLLASVIQAQCPLILNCSNQTTQFCDQSTNDAGLWNDPGFLDPVHNQHDLCEGGIDLTVKALDACGGTGVTFSYILLLDLDHNGTQESVVVGDQTYNPGVVPFGNANNPGYSASDFKSFDQRAVSAANKYQFALQQTQSGDTLQAILRFNTQQTPGVFEQAELPLGTHKILWLLRHGGMTDTCAQVFTIKDCKKPFVQCLPSLSVNIMQTKMIQLFANDFIQYAEDNCTPNDQLTLSVVKSNQSTGVFPVDATGAPVFMIAFDCSELGNNTIQLWTRDKAGNASFCEATINVQDNAGNCSGSGGFFMCAATETGMPLNNFVIDLVGNMPGVPPLSIWLPSAQNGCFNLSSFSFNTGNCLYPYKYDNYINGVSTFDLVLISKHILGLEDLNSPYKLIAADANKSGSVTTFDIVALRKLILGVYTELPNNSSWRFISNNFVFPNASNPFQSSFPENYCLVSPSSFVTNVCFTAIKIGDVNNNAVASIAAPDPPSGEMIQLNIPDLEVSAGETIDIPLSFADACALDGWQWRLGWDDGALELIGVTPGKMTTLDNFNFSNTSFSGSWSEGVPTTFLPGTPLVTLRMRAHTSLRLREALHLDDRLSAEAYTDDNQIHPLGLRAVVTATNAPLNGLKIYPAQPNPTTAGATLPLQLDRPLSGLFRLLDLSGRVCYERVLDLEPGAQLLEIPAAAMGQAGVYLWQIVSEAQQASGKILKQ